MEKNTLFSKRFDFVLLIFVLIASAIGMFAIYSATASETNQAGFLIKQGAALILGLGVMLFLSFPDYGGFMRFRYVIFGFAAAILILVLFIGHGAEDTGTQGWIAIGGINIQPSEVAKVCFILTLGSHIARVGDEINSLRNIALLTVHLGVYMGLVLLQPDFGTAMVFAVIFIVMTYLGGLTLWFYLVCAALAAAAIIPVWRYVLKDYQKDRFLMFLHPEDDPLGSGYHIIQSKIAVGSGQLFGRGYMQGSQTQMGYLPEKQTDFIFSSVCEEFGFVGGAIVAVVLFVIVARCFIDAYRAKDKFGELIAAGVGAMLLFHTFENIGMCIGLMPITGIPLPFISYGGSSLVTNLAAIGLVLNVCKRKRRMKY